MEFLNVKHLNRLLRNENQLFLYIIYSYLFQSFFNYLSMAFRSLPSVPALCLDCPSRPPMMRRSYDAPSWVFTYLVLRSIEFSQKTLLPICRKKSRTCTRSTSSMPSSLESSQLTLVEFARLAHHSELENPAELVQFYSDK